MQLLKKLNNGRVYSFVGIAVLLLAYNNCSEVAFKNVPEALVVTEETDEVIPGTDVSLYNATVNFPKETALPVDMVWVIDNSGSMAEEAAHVRTNFASFINYIKDRTDLKLALISQNGSTKTGVDLPFTAPNLLHLVRQVESNDAPDLLSSALCIEGVNSPQPCKDNRVHVDNELDGKLMSFFRPATRKTFVFVTDDESAMAKKDFLDLVKATLPGQTVTVSGFVGLGRSGNNNLPSPCQEKTGVQYQEMAAATAGSIFNICDSDWQASFSKLAQQTVFDATRPIPIPVAIRTAQILSVSLNGSKIPDTMWKITIDGLIIDAILTKGLNSASVQIEHIKL